MSRRVKTSFHQFLYGERVVDFMVASRWNDDRKAGIQEFFDFCSSVGKLRSSEISGFSIVKLVKIVRWNLSRLHSGDLDGKLHFGESSYLFIICNSSLGKILPCLRDRRIIRSIILSSLTTFWLTNSLMIFRDFLINLG